MIGTGPLDPSTARLCTRSRANCAAFWYARSAIAMPCMPTAKRAAFIMMNMYSRPRFSSPIRWPMAPAPTSPLSSPYTSTAVGLALMPSLCSIDAQ